MALLLRYCVFFILFALLNRSAFSQVYAIEPSYDGLFASKEPTMSFLFEAPDAKATLVFMPGGEGRIRINSNWTASHPLFRNYFYGMLRNLSDPAHSTGLVNVVYVDSPADLATVNYWSTARTRPEHISRVVDVVRFYKQKLGKPIWLMGHSMGTISVSETYKFLQEKGAEGDIAGLILSGSVNAISLNYETTKLPVLVIHHEEDQCAGSTLWNAKRLQAKLKDGGDGSTDLAVIQGGTGQSDFCHAGHHMYFGATEQAAAAIDQFLKRYSTAAAPQK